jgi:glycosyltransferase involved in cell wall biosynthesis
MVFSYTIKNNIYGGLSAAALRIPFVPNVTGLGTLFSKDSALASSVSQLYRVAFRSAPVVFFQNEHDLERLTAARIVRPNQARLLPGSGVDLSHFSVAPLPGSHRAPTFLMVARLLREKGVAEFIAAARRVRQDVPGAIFKILGDYEAEGPAAVRKAEVEAWVAEKIVQYLGTVTDVRSVIASADCVVLPSYYPEGTPRVLLEAAAMGRPVVTTDTPGCRGTVEHGATGFIVAPRDAASLADAMLGVALAHPVRRAEMGLAGRSRMKVLYDEKIVVDAYLEIAERFGRRTNGRRT